MRIIAGSHRGRPLVTPSGQETRPTSDRMRQSLFNILENAPWSPIHWSETYILDAFAGSGALGFEALSRGARHAWFWDISPHAITCIHKNAQNLGFTTQSTIVKCSPQNPPAPKADINLLFLDPPYHQGLVTRALNACQSHKWLGQDCLAVIETAKDEEIDLVDGWQQVDQRFMGKSQLLFWQKIFIKFD